MEERIQKSTCRVDYEGNQLGSSFWVDDDTLITAAHVVEEVKNKKLEIQTPRNQILDVSVIYMDINSDKNPGSDLALLKTSKTPNECETLNIKPEIPSIGSEVIWSGYARLFGEPKIDRQRFGWGKVASKKYSNERKGSFFEVDGLFNPSHSGGPVIESKSKSVVGVVSARAGGFRKLEESMRNDVVKINELFNLATNMGTGAVWANFQIDTAEKFFKTKEYLESLGLTINTDTGGEKNKISVNREELPILISKIQNNISGLLLDTAKRTFQMGVGIASGGNELGNLLEKF